MVSPTLKANLRRILSPDGYLEAPTVRVDTVLDITEPYNNWTVDYATIFMDMTILMFQEGAVSHALAWRCQNVIAYFDGYFRVNNHWSAGVQTNGGATVNCQMWPCCAGQTKFPRLFAGSPTVPSGVVLTPYTRVGGPAFGSNGAEWLMIEYGPGSISNPVRFYISVEMQLYENEVP